MEFIDKSFNAVCKEGMIEKIYDLVSPIDTYTPINNTVNNPSLPLSFELNLVKPIPNTLNSTWTLNTVNFANDIDDVSISDTDLHEGENTLSVSVIDNTAMLRIDNHETINIHTITWTINYNSLSVEDIISREDDYKISIFPNPTSSFLTFKNENNTSSKLKINLLSIDGKKVKSTKLNSLSKINISKLNSGIYIANIYADNILIASKKIVKN